MVTILNAILLWLIFGTEPGWSLLMTLQRYTPSFKASWKVPSGKGSPAIASSQLFASASICGSCFAACCKEEEVHRELFLQKPLKWDLGRWTSKCSYDASPQSNTTRTHTRKLGSAIAHLFLKLSGHSVSLWSLGHVCQYCSKRVA